MTSLSEKLCASWICHDDSLGKEEKSKKAACNRGEKRERDMGKKDERTDRADEKRPRATIGHQGCPQAFLYQLRKRLIQKICLICVLSFYDQETLERFANPDQTS